MLIFRAWATCGLTCYVIWQTLVRLVVAQGIRISTKLKNIDCITGRLNILKFFSNSSHFSAITCYCRLCHVNWLAHRCRGYWMTFWNSGKNTVEHYTLSKIKGTLIIRDLKSPLIKNARSEKLYLYYFYVSILSLYANFLPCVTCEEALALAYRTLFLF